MVRGAVLPTEAKTMNAEHPPDFHAWLVRTARLLREHRWDELDAEQLAEEVEDLSKSERRGVSSQLTRLLLHLLKWRFQPQRRSDSWLDSIADARLQLQLALDDSPSLRGYPAEQLAVCYQKARRAAARQTGLAPERFPEQCAFSLDDVLNEDWLPDAAD
jgi:hypothetical protein